MSSSTATRGAGLLPLAHALELGSVLTGMELTFVSSMQDEVMTISRTTSPPGASPWTSLAEGSVFPLGDTFCQRMLTGAPRHTSDADVDPHYREAPLRSLTGARSYLGVPLRDAEGRALGTMCAVDRAEVTLDERRQNAFAALAPAVAEGMFPAPAPVTVQRTATGWLVTGSPEGDEAAEDLTSAMVLADLIAGELAGPASRPPRVATDGDELARLRTSVTQLEHALAARVVVEQAIGVLAERRRVSPRAAFETLRGVARGSGRRVHSLAADIVASASGPGTGLISTLARPAGAPSPSALANLVRARVSTGP